MATLMEAGALKSFLQVACISLAYLGMDDFYIPTIRKATTSKVGVIASYLIEADDL